jgi:hypothetical protein
MYGESVHKATTSYTKDLLFGIDFGFDFDRGWIGIVQKTKKQRRIPEAENS